MQNSIKPTYSIILMRDDCGVSTFRLHCFWIKLFVLFLIILAAAGVAGAYGTFYYKKRYEVSSAERRALQRSLGENKIKLESLTNEFQVGRFTGLGDVPAGHMPGLSSSQGSTPGASSPYVSAPITTLPTPRDLALLLRQNGPVRTAGTEDDPDLEELMEKHPIKISNLRSAFESEDRLRLSYDLNNQQNGLTLTGRCGIALITREGAVIDIAPSTRGVLTFQISRFRKIEILLRLPPNVKKEDIAKIQISAQANDLPPYYKNFTLGE
ncbi:MAG: hypothetical protein LBD82_02565 [Deltaproteobacteria bacterium]|jgi:hypothetical protein|nr:hypothetical protein [Deltaproteobacteria bacterium]